MIKVVGLAGMDQVTTLEVVYCGWVNELEKVEGCNMESISTAVQIKSMLSYITGSNHHHFLKFNCFEKFLLYLTEIKLYHIWTSVTWLQV